MSFWNCLPPEIKQHVVKKMDFMGRYSLRCTNHYHRNLVDSTKLYIPRIRYDQQNNDAVIMLYTGIDKWMRWFFHQEGNYVSIVKSENERSADEAALKFIPNRKCLPYAIQFLFHLLSHKTITIGTLEVNINRMGCFEFECQSSQILKIGENRLLRVHKIIYPKEELHEAYCFFYDVCCRDVLKSQEYLSFKLSSQNMVPVTMYFDKVHNANYFPICKTDLSMETPTENSLEECKDRLLRHIYLYDTEEYTRELGKHVRVGTYGEVYSMKKKGFKPSQPSATRWEEDDIVFRTNTSKCGKWTDMYPKKSENDYLELYKKQTCGLGILCKRCSDPFDYWYHQTLPHRLNQRLELDSFFEVACDDSQNYDYKREYELVKKKLKEMEDQRRKILKNMKGKHKKYPKNSAPEDVKSWGFRKTDVIIPTEMFARDEQRTEKSVEFQNSRNYNFITYFFGTIFCSFVFYYLFTAKFWN